MAKAFEVISKGFNKVLVRMTQGPKKVREAAVVCLKRFIGPEVVSVAADYAPEDTSDLATSIDFEVRGLTLVVGVPANSPAGPYARPMHEDHYIAGPGTVIKGQLAGRQYITRAMNDSMPRIRLLFGECMDTVAKDE